MKPKLLLTRYHKLELIYKQNTPMANHLFLTFLSLCPDPEGS